MTVDNCLHFLKMAEMYGLADCKRDAKGFILDNFESVAHNDDFKTVSGELLCELLSDDRLKVCCCCALCLLLLRCGSVAAALWCTAICLALYVDRLKI